MQLWRSSGLMLLWTGIIHTSIGVIFGWDMLVAVTSDGIWNTIDVPVSAGARHTRAELLWFLMVGISWIMLGVKFHDDIKTRQQPLTKLWGWLLLAQGLLVAIVFPQTGAWLFIPQGLIIIFANFNPNRLIS